MSDGGNMETGAAKCPDCLGTGRRKGRYCGRCSGYGSVIAYISASGKPLYALHPSDPATDKQRRQSK